MHAFSAEKTSSLHVACGTNVAFNVRAGQTNIGEVCRKRRAGERGKHYGGGGGGDKSSGSMNFR